MAYTVAVNGVPEELTSQIPQNNNGNRAQLQCKFATKPKCLCKNKLYKNSLRSRLYYYNTLPHELTTLPTNLKFKNGVKKFLKTKRHV